MIMPTQVLYSESQIMAWLRGLLSVALADNDYSDKEQLLIQQLIDSQINIKSDKSDSVATVAELSKLKPITPMEIAIAFGKDDDLAQNFLRTAVMVALVDGDYSATEDQLIQQFYTALEQKENVMSELRAKLDNSDHSDLLNPIREWLDGLEIKEPKLARFLCKVIPSQCPFERDIFLFGRKIVHIPAMCQINPLFDQLVGLRFRSLCFLADVCGEDVSEFV
jgi:tellurite resistance protein